MTVPRRFVLVMAGVGCVGVAVFACWVSGADFLLLVEHTVVQPQVLALIVWSVAVFGSVGLLVLVLLRLRRQQVGRSGRLIAVVVGEVLAVTLFGTGVWCMAAAVVAAGVHSLGPHAYTVLPASDDQACTLVAYEIGVLRQSNGRLYSADAFGFARPIGQWRADEIQLPVRDGNYSLEWRNGVGTLAFRTTRFIAPDRLEVTCHR